MLHYHFWAFVSVIIIYGSPGFTDGGAGIAASQDPWSHIGIKISSVVFPLYNTTLLCSHLKKQNRKTSDQSEMQPRVE